VTAFDFAPWSYVELAAAVGLLALYRDYVRECFAQGEKPVAERDFLVMPGFFAILPADFIRALRAGANFGRIVAVPPTSLPPAARAPRLPSR
jgi:hypothetical protein